MHHYSSVQQTKLKMALILHPSSAPSYLLQTKPHPLLLHSPTKLSTKPIKSLDSTQSQEPTSQSNGGDKPTSQGQGFGPSKPKPSKKGEKGRRDRASVIRRAPVEKPQFSGVLSKEDEEKAKEQMKNESAFLLAWLGLGGVILVEGITLASSGFLPEEWDKLFVKYLYPVFTPTVFLFVAGTVTYGVLKYLQNEKLKSEN